MSYNCFYMNFNHVTLYIISLQVLQSNSKYATHWKLNSQNNRIESLASSNEKYDKIVKNISNEITKNIDPVMNILAIKKKNYGSFWRIESDIQEHMTEEYNHKTIIKQSNINLEDSPASLSESVDHSIYGKTCSNKIQLLNNEINNLYYNVKPILNQIKIAQAENNLQIEKDKKIKLQDFLHSYISSDSHLIDHLLETNTDLLSMDVYHSKDSLGKIMLHKQEWLQEILKSSYGSNDHEMKRIRRIIQAIPDEEMMVFSSVSPIEESISFHMTRSTALIIIGLVFVVAWCIILTLDADTSEEAGMADGLRLQRHFNRAMAMRSMRQGINARLTKLRRQCM